MSFPATRDALKESGYQFDNHATCRGEDCGAEIEWWITPAKKKMSFNLMIDGDSPTVPHITTCPNRDDFKRR